MQAESLFAIRVDKELKLIPKSHWFNIQQVAIRGVPDRLGVINGRFVALEFKVSPEARRSALQTYHINKILELGGYARFVYLENWDVVHGELMLLAVN